jgi:hypothetical protein
VLLNHSSLYHDANNPGIKIVGISDSSIFLQVVSHQSVKTFFSILFKGPYTSSYANKIGAFININNNIDVIFLIFI